MALALLSSLPHAEPKEPGEVGAGGLGAPLHARGRPCQQTVPPRARAEPLPLAAGGPGQDPCVPLAAEEPQETDLLHGTAEGGRRLRGWALTRQQLRALFTKRLLHARRSTRGFFAQVRPEGAPRDGMGRCGASPDPSRPPSRPRRSSCPPSSSASRCSSASSCRPSGSTRRCASSPGCTGSSSPSSGAIPGPTPPVPPPTPPRCPLTPLPLAAMMPQGTPTRLGCWAPSWPSPASAPSA